MKHQQEIFYILGEIILHQHAEQCWSTDQDVNWESAESLEG